MVRPHDRAVGKFGADAVEVVSRILHGSELRRAAAIERVVLERQRLKQCADFADAYPRDSLVHYSDRSQRPSYRAMNATANHNDASLFFSSRCGSLSEHNPLAADQPCTAPMVRLPA